MKGLSHHAQDEAGCSCFYFSDEKTEAQGGGGVLSDLAVHPGVSFSLCHRTTGHLGVQAADM